MANGDKAAAIAAAVEAGDILASMDEISISAKASPDGKEHKREYRKLVAVTIDGMLALCAGKIAPATAKPAEGDDKRTAEEKAPGVCDYFNYGFDLGVRSNERSKLVSGLEDPKKAIDKAVANLVAAAGMAEVDARAFILAQREKAGLAVA